MKRIFKKFWPILTVAIFAVALLLGWGFHTLFPSPTRAVEGYIRASLQYDVGGLMKYASDYQLKELSGNSDLSRKELENSLTVAYKQAEQYKQNGKTVFRTQVEEVYTPKDKAFEELMEKYAFKADASKVKKAALVTGSYRTEQGTEKSFRVIAVKCGLRWYYGFIQ